MTGANRAACLLLVIALQCGRAAAQTAAIEPDRPDLTNGPHLVTSGTVQFELGGIFTHDTSGRHMAAAPVAVRIGVSKGFEARFAVDNQFVAIGGETGIGMIQAGAKIRVWSDSHGEGLVSVLPAVLVPTSGGDPDVSIVVATGVDLGPRARVDVNYGATSLGPGEGRDTRLVQHLLSASASVSMTGRWSGFFELYGTSRERVDGAAAIAFDTGAQFLVAPHVVADVGVDFGVSADAPSFSVFAGLSFALRRQGRATSASRFRGRG